ncbi:M20/M25/M40 family metallo-hydrolase [Oceanithermus profundus]|uniref:Peptidase M20 n=1 Tax=Oceanithermus profundus (strain DSM 14977 / NBRC 100410 / VKM B-2274 / 506) TaxID=670487 RepID=E4U4S9_OCEP5|nr:M20/M25/M40 family metallo-hydrolase [Oceanithermus profundus]ADR37146.1 peptidase M20 [Oceanithermus profundus DSM 14977]
MEGTNVVQLLQQLIRFDTTNPPGREAEAMRWVQGWLKDHGIDSELLARDPERPNLVARLRGRGEAPPILVYGHLDVVTTEGQDWSVPPFEGVERDGFVWGRGALDMKGAVAMYLASLVEAHAAGELAGDVVLALVSDEEAGGDYGASWLADEHPERFAGIKHALGEFGGFSLEIAGRRFYPVMVAEKQISWIELTFTGPAGHGSLIHKGGAMAKLGQALVALDKKLTPVHVTPVAERMFREIAAGLSGAARAGVLAALKPALTDRVLEALGEGGRLFQPLFHNTVNATIVTGGDKVNVVPAEVRLQLDGRLLPGFSPDDLIAELEQIIPVPFEARVVRHDPGPGEVDWSLYPLLKRTLEEADPGARAVPLLLSGVTDGRHFARLGIQTYGFAPMKLPPDLNFSRLIHAADERIPVEALEFGVQTLRRFFRDYGRG